MASEKRFVLKDVFKNVKSMDNYDTADGDEKKHFGVPWGTSLMLEKDFYGFGFACEYVKSDNWSVDTEYEIRLIGNGKQLLTSRGTYFHDDINEDWDEMMTIKASQIDKYLVDGNLTFECHVKILKMEGFKGIKSKFSEESMKKYSDVVLVVDGEKFYVSKGYLASRSPYFDTLLMGQFKESNQSEVVLHGVEVDDFQNFLEILYHEAKLTDQNVEVVLRVADMYETKCVVQQAEEFLARDSIKPIKEKFAMAVKYNLTALKVAILSNCVDAADIRSLLPDDLNDLNKGVMAELFKKHLSATISSSSN